MKRIFQYRNRNLISYAEYGDENGYPILVQHGLIASICDHQLFEGLTESELRLILIARPGYGESSPYYMSNVAEWGEIISILVDELRLSRFDILGISSGAPYSYSIGHKFPYKAKNIFILSGTPALYDDRVLAVWPYPVDKNADIPSLQKLAHDLFFSNLSKEALSQNDIKDTMKNNCFGIALDFKLRCNNWGFLLSEIKQDVYMQHSKTDDQIPFAAAETTSKLLPRCHFDIRENGDHFSKETFAQFINSIILQHYGIRDA